MENFPKNLVDQYLKTCVKLKKIEKALIKRFGPNLFEVLNDFALLTGKFESAAIYQYAAMCQLGVAKCESYNHNNWSECQAILKAARLFLRAHEDINCLLFKRARCEYREAALHCFNQAVEKCPDDGAMKAAIIREIMPLQPHYEFTSTFNSPAHRIYELELAVENCLKQQQQSQRDYLQALHHLDDIVDIIYERKKQHLYKELLRQAEITRILLLVALSLPPARQTPAHIKLIEYYIHLAESLGSDNLDNGIDDDDNEIHVREMIGSFGWQPGQFLLMAQKLALSDIVLSWHLENFNDMKLHLQEFRQEFSSLSISQRFLIQCILDKLY